MNWIIVHTASNRHIVICTTKQPVQPFCSLLPQFSEYKLMVSYEDHEAQSRKNTGNSTVQAAETNNWFQMNYF